MFDDCIPTTAVIRRALKPGLYEVELKNGKLATGHLGKPLLGTELPDGAAVKVEMTPYDFDQARIVAVLPAADG